jgi:hypothetical protein
MSNKNIPHKQVLNVDIIIEQHENQIYKLEIINKQKNKDDMELIDDINKQLLLSNELYDLCSNKLKYCDDDLKYKQLIEEFTKNKNKEFDILKTQFELREYEILEKNKINLENVIYAEQRKFNNLQEEIDYKISLETKRINNDYQIQIHNLNYELKFLKEKLLEEENKLNADLALSNLISTKFDLIDKHLTSKDNIFSTVSIGDIGEQFIFDYLQKSLELSDASLEIVKGKSNAGDLFLKYNNSKICIESKNHTAPITQANINRFLLTDLNNPNYNSGIFISLKSEFVNSSGIKHFDIKLQNNKPSIFLSQFFNRPDDIILAIKILDFIIYHQSFNSSNVNDYITLLMHNLDLFNSIIDINADNIKNLNKSNLLIKTKKNEIESFLKINKPQNSIKQEVIKYTCEICKLGFSKKIDFTKHSKDCK